VRPLPRTRPSSGRLALPVAPAARRGPLVPFLLLAALLLWSVAGCGSGAAPSPTATDSSWAPKADTARGLLRVAHTAGERFVLRTAGGERGFIAGVNLGSTIPGTQPGQLAATAADYRRWFPQMAALGLHAVRVYTILMPSFYTELAAYNTAHPAAPLYLIQGVWIPEEQFLAGHDVFAPAVRVGFLREIDDAVAAVHGSLSRSPRKGVAYGRWTADVSPWLLSYSLGVEWDPEATLASDKANAGRAPYKGRYFSSHRDASPTETWLAGALDRCARDEARRGRTMPLTFTNWPTTDPLEHPDEPLVSEDLVGVDANHISASARWPGGYYASYHVYPYYPDFQRHEPELQQYIFHGHVDPYAGYIAALRRHHHGMPLIITEFGVPSSIGMAHMGPVGRSQGDHSEQQAMAMDAGMLRVLKDQGCAGGFVFEWADEWFKFTCNTIDYERPAGRRQMWLNPLTNEEHFGLVATDPGATPAATVDGNDAEWTRNQSQVIYEARTGLREVRAVKDEGYLYLQLKFDDANVWQHDPVTIGLDLLPGGNVGLPGAPHQDPGADYAVVIGPGRQAKSLVAASIDPFRVIYGDVAHDFASLAPAYPVTPGVGVWDLQRMIINRPLTVPSTGQRLPIESFDVGDLRSGTADPASPRFDCRVVWAAGDCIELRLPYELIGFSDPSSNQALVVHTDGRLTTRTEPRVGIDIAVGGKLAVTKGYGWDPWQKVGWHERPKAGVAAYAAAVRDVSR
jgi:hypothetical protein